MGGGGGGWRGRKSDGSLLFCRCFLHGRWKLNLRVQFPLFSTSFAQDCVWRIFRFSEDMLCFSLDLKSAARLDSCASIVSKY